MIDTHTHIVAADEDRYPLTPRSLSGEWYKETPHDAEAFLACMDACGVEAAVLVQPVGAYSYDNSYTADSAVATPKRLIINSTFGLGGLVDFAAAIGMPKHEEDFDQTLAVWGVESGPYLELPLLGPNTFRSVPGMAADTVTNPLTWLGSSPLDYAATALKTVDKRAQLDSAIKLRDKSALDPYVFQREAYLQRRRFQIYDGNPPLDDDGPLADK
jgi:ABC-type transporter lipoprotein component MlaA